MKKILVALDRSPTSRVVLDRAEKVARVFGSKLILFQVIETSTGPADLADAVESRLARAEAMAYLGAVSTDLKESGLEVSNDIGVGDPALEILRVAKLYGADLIVLGPNRDGGSPNLLGGTALKVAARTETSLLMARPDDVAEEEGGVMSVLAAVDGSPSGDWAAFHAAALARAQEAQLLLVHVMVDPELVGAPAQGPLRDLAAALVRSNKTAACQHLERLGKRLMRPGLRIRTEVVGSHSAAEGVLEVTTNNGVDLVVLGADGWSTHAERLHGSVAHSLLVSGVSSVLVCQHTASPSGHPSIDARVAARPARLRHSRAR